MLGHGGAAVSSYQHCADCKAMTLQASCGACLRKAKDDLVDPKAKDGPVKRHRTWGWFPTFALAEKAVLENHGDMYEDGYYNAAVLEEFPWGPMALASKEHWYYAKAKHHKTRLATYTVKPMDKPEALQGLVNFGMG